MIVLTKLVCQIISRNMKTPREHTWVRWYRFSKI